MKIVHVCLGCFYIDNYSYQENMLPKFHKELGYEVEIIASLMTFDKDGKESLIKKGGTYINEHGIKVRRLEYKWPNKIYKKLKRYKNTFSALVEARPDILFIHGCQFQDIDQIVKFLKKNPTIKVYVDNHADFSNSATNWISRVVLHKFLWKNAAHLIEPYTTKFYGVLPARVNFLKDIYKLPEDKCGLLVMGGDDDLIKESTDLGVREKLRRKYGIKETDFLIVTGGKIDHSKKQVFLLLKALRNIPNDNVKLIIFGSIVPELKREFFELCDNKKIQYIGWIHSKQTYDFFIAAELVVFPGRHSVLWEQVVAQGVPMICRYWEGTTHIDLGGNVEFLKEDSIDEITKVLTRIIVDNHKYEKMLKVAVEDGKKTFSYKEIAKRSIEMV